MEIGGRGVKNPWKSAEKSVYSRKRIHHEFSPMSSAQVNGYSEEIAAVAVTAAAVEEVEIRVPTPEPEREPSPEPVREPSPEPIRQPSPEPIREPSPEPIRDPSPPPREPTPPPVIVKEPSPVQKRRSNDLDALMAKVDTSLSRSRIGDSVSLLYRCSLLTFFFKKS